MFCKFRLYILIKSILGTENWWLPWFFVCFSDMCYRSSSSPQILIVNNSSFEHNWRCSMYNNFSNLYLEQVLVNELKNSWVDSWVSKLVKLVSWWYRPAGQFADDRSSCCLERLCQGDAPTFDVLGKLLLKSDWMVKSSATTNDVQSYRWLDSDSAWISEFNVVWCVISYLLTDEGQYPETSIRIGSSNVISLYCVL